MKACWWGQNFFYNLVLANLARLFHPAMSFRDCLWFTEKWNTQSRRHSRKQLWYAACISVFPDRDFLNPKWVPKCCAVQVPRSHVRNMPTLERTKVHLLGFSQTLKGFITSAIMRRGTGFLIWYSCSCRLVPRVSCVPVARPGVIGQWGGGGRVRTWSLRPTSKPLALQEIKDSRKYCEPSLAVLHFPVASGWCFCTPLLF